MINFFNKFKIPTLLGLGLIILGLFSGLYLVLNEQVYLSQAAPNLTPQDITISNITDNSVTISWQTNIDVPSFITYGQNNAGEQTSQDNRDTNPISNNSGPKPRLNHYFTLTNLLPDTNYSFRISSGKLKSEVMKFKTATPIINPAGFTPIIGSVISSDNNPLSDGIVYLSIPNATTQSALIRTDGNFLIPISQIRKEDLSGIFPLTEKIAAKLIIRSEKGNSNILFLLQENSPPLPIIKLNQDIDLTTPDTTPSPSPNINDLDKYDLNNDGKINSADFVTLTTCISKKSNLVLSQTLSCTKTDINKDGFVDQKDLDLMSQKLRDLESL